LWQSCLDKIFLRIPKWHKWLRWPFHCRSTMWQVEDGSLQPCDTSKRGSGGGREWENERVREWESERGWEREWGVILQTHLCVFCQRENQQNCKNAELFHLSFPLSSEKWKNCEFSDFEFSLWHVSVVLLYGGEGGVGQASLIGCRGRQISEREFNSQAISSAKSPADLCQPIRLMGWVSPRFDLL
jgi:hypothetical protein